MTQGFLIPADDDQPSEKAVKEFWRDLTVSHVDLDHPAIGLLLMEFLETHSKAAFACFEISDHPVLQWYGSRNMLDEIDFFRKILPHPTIRDLLVGLLIPKKIRELDVHWGTSFILDGTFAQVLVNGGAQGCFGGEDSEAKEIGLNFCDALFEGRYSENLVYDSFDSWTPWFSGDANYDHTWFGIDKRLSRFWLLAITDEE